MIRYCFKVSVSAVVWRCGRRRSRLTSCRTSAPGRSLTPALTSSSRRCMWPRSASPPAGSHLRTWCTPLFPSLDKENTEKKLQDGTFGELRMVWEDMRENMAHLRRWHTPDDTARRPVCGRCNNCLDHKSTDICFLEDWEKK